MTRLPMDNLSPSKPSLGYASRTQAIEALYNQGVSPEAIAARIGLNKNAVSTFISRIRRRQRKLTHQLDKPGHNVFHAAAVARGISPDELLGRIVDVLIAEPAMIDNVLDDDGGDL